jgi:hypothetical protein
MGSMTWKPYKIGWIFYNSHFSLNSIQNSDHFCLYWNGSDAHSKFDDLNTELVWYLHVQCLFYLLQ